ICRRKSSSGMSRLAAKTFACCSSCAYSESQRTTSCSPRHRQVKLEGDGKASKLARVANLCGGLGASDLGPDREGLCADGSVLGGRKVIAAERKEVVDLIVGGEEPLRLAGGTVRNSVYGRAVEPQPAMALVKRSPKRTANWAFAI